MLIPALTSVLFPALLSLAPPMQGGEIIAWGAPPTGTPIERDFVEVKGGSGHAIGLRTDGSLVSWGSDSEGLVSDSPLGFGFIDIAAGSAHSLAISSTGLIHAWGDDSRGQVRNTPTTHDFVQVAAGEFHSVGLRTDGSIVSWGDNAWNVVTDTPTGTGFIQVAAGRIHSLALRTDGSIISWGRDSSGQVSGTPTGAGFRSVAAGWGHSLAIAQDSSIVAWGKNSAGQVSDTPVGLGFSAVDGGISHSTALRSDGSIVSWGGDVWGAVTDTPSGTAFFAIAVGTYWSSYAIRATFDSDADGIDDDLEDSNGNGIQDPGETDPFDQDSDDDGLSDGEEVNIERVDPRWLAAPSGQHYRLAPPETWSQSSGNARAVGAELASIGSVQEEIWLLETFGSTSESAWIGLNDFGGNFEWSDGSALTYTHWGPGEPGASFVAAFVGGDSFPEPGAWYTGVAGASARRSVWELHSSTAPVAYTDPLNWDTDGDGLSDGMEVGLDAIVWDGDLDGDGNPDVGGTDPALFVADLDPLSTTSPIDTDSDDDGLADGVEDVNGDGAAGPGETMAHDADSDLDGLTDGLELGLEYGTVDTDGRVFLSDDDPITTTDPLNSDSDGGGVPDGVEDQDRNGAVDTWDTDPNDPNDEALAVYFSGVVPGGTVHIEVWNATPFETVIPAYSLKGPGPSPTGLGINADLSRPIALMDPFLTDAAGRASVDRLPVPANAPLGLPVWFQAVEVPLSSGGNPRAANPVLLPVGAN